MDDQIRQLERLSNLRDCGALTEAEFQSQKTALLRAADATSAGPGASTQVLGQRDGAKGMSAAPARRMFTIATILVIVTGIALVTWATRDRLYGTGGQSHSSGSEGGQNTSPKPADDGWQYKKLVDPMADVAADVAVGKIEGQAFNAEVAISCDDRGDITYGAATFDHDQAPVDMRTEQVPSENGGYLRTRYEARRDDLPVRTFYVPDPKFSNQLEDRSFPAKWTTAEMGPEWLAQARILTLRLFTVAGEETFRIAQDKAPLRMILDRCLAQREALRKGGN